MVVSGGVTARAYDMEDSFDEVDAVIHPLGAPQGVGVVELDEIDAFAWIAVTTTVDLLVGVASVSWNDFVGGCAVVVLGSRFTALFHVTARARFRGWGAAAFL